MNDNLLDFPTDYLPSEEEFTRLNNIQRTIESWRKSLVHEWDMKHFSAGERLISRERFHTGVRDNWKIFQGFKENKPLESNCDKIEA